jgi:ADP-ribose pyrophosphatase YjhB (NUDIX family)
MTALPRWLEWAREIQALAQSGNAFALNDFQRERYQRLTEIAAEIVSASTGLDDAEVASLYMHQQGYATPKVDVRAAVFRDRQILLVQERIDGGWTLPGGWADVGDRPSEAAEREVLEEAGLTVRAARLVGVYDANRLGPLELFHAYKLVFLCTELAGELRPSPETTAVAFFDVQRLPGKFSGERTQMRHIEQAFALLDQPDLPVQFD